jgi:HlyD family secretion protein
MHRRWLCFGVVGVTLFLTSCGGQTSADRTVLAATVRPAERAAPAQNAQKRTVRASGTIQPVNAVTVQAPNLYGQQPRMVLTALIENGSRVKKGDDLAEFDRVQQLDAARESQAKFEDLGHQVEQRIAQNRAETEKRRSDRQKAEADLAKAEIQLRKGVLLNEIDRLKNETKAADAKARVASLKKSHAYQDTAEAAALRILELQRDRQKVAWERAEANAEKLVIKAPISGMAVLENIWRNGSMGPPQEGDQMYPGQPLLRIFDPSHMLVHAYVAEPDGAVLLPSARATVQLDAYPNLRFTARFESASPVAAAAVGSPIKTFAARFRLDQTDPNLLPDLSAAVIIEPGEEQ